MIVCQSRHHISLNVRHDDLKLVKPEEKIMLHRREERKRGGEGRGEGNRKGEGRREKEVERLLLSSSKSTVNNAGNYQGRQKKGRQGSGEQEIKGKGEGGRKKEREEEGKHYSSVPSKHEMLGYFNKNPPFIWERKRRQETEGESSQDREGQITSRDAEEKLGNGK